MYEMTLLKRLQAQLRGRNSSIWQYEVDFSLENWLGIMEPVYMYMYIFGSSILFI